MSKYDEDYYKRFLKPKDAAQAAFASSRVSLPELPKQRKGRSQSRPATAKRVSDLPELMTALEVSKYLKRSYDYVLNLIKDGKLKTVGDGWQKRISVRDLEEYLHHGQAS